MLGVGRAGWGVRGGACGVGRTATLTFESWYIDIPAITEDSDTLPRGASTPRAELFENAHINRRRPRTADPMTTMRDVATQAGVSVMTVSNVINGRGRVGAKTALRVLEVIAELDYEVNLTARGLRAGRTGTIALIVPRFHPYYSDLANRLGIALEAKGRHLVVEQSGASRDGELVALSPARLQRYDGVLLSAIGLGYDDVDRLRASIPLVLLGEQEMPPRFDQVRMDNEGGARLATRHLLRTGSSRVLIVGGDLLSTDGMPAARTAGWEQAHADEGIAVDPERVIALRTYEAPEAQRVVEDLIASGMSFDGVVAVTDSVAMGVLAGLRSAGRDVPRDVQVIGFDNLSLNDFLGPGLSSVDPGSDVAVIQMLRLLDQRIEGASRAGEDGAAVPPTERVTAPAHLVLRGSTRI